MPSLYFVLKNQKFYDIIHNSKIMGCHALGTAAYVALCQTKYKKPLEEFGEKEICEIAQTIHETDAYEVALNALGYKPDGKNKRCLDHNIEPKAEVFAKNGKISKEEIPAATLVPYHRS